MVKLAEEVKNERDDRTVRLGGVVVEKNGEGAVSRGVRDPGVPRTGGEVQAGGGGVSCVHVVAVAADSCVRDDAYLTPLKENDKGVLVVDTQAVTGTNI